MREEGKRGVMTDDKKRGWNLEAASFAPNCNMAVFRMSCEDARSWYGYEREPEGGDSEYLVSSVHGHWRGEDWYVEHWKMGASS